MLIALGLFGHYSLLARNLGPKARVGFVFIVIGLMVTALADLAILAIVPPMLSPLVAMGLILAAPSHRDNPSFPRLGRHTFLGMGVLLWLSFLGTLLLPRHVFDRVNGYIVFGVMANLLFGVGWMVFGAMHGRRQPAG